MQKSFTPVDEISNLESDLTCSLVSISHELKLFQFL